MTENIYNPKAALRTTKIIYFILLAGPILFFALILYIHDGDYPSSYALNDAMNLGFLAVLPMIPLALYYSKRVLNQIQPDSDLRSKLAKFNNALIIRTAIWVGMANFGVVVFLISDNAYSFWILVISIIGVISNYPSISRVTNKAKLTQSEIDQITD